MAPKSREFHALVREVLVPAMKDLGFARPKGAGLGAWTRAEGSSWLVAWAQLSSGNYGDDTEGYSFTFEMQLGDEPVAGLGGPRERLYHLLSDEERVEFMAIHNDVMAKVVPNARLKNVLTSRAWAGHVERLTPRNTPFSRLDDPWLHYTDEDDVRIWLRFLVKVLPGAILRFIASAAP
jgi:hypothetical protein